jgi:hypothetical protein
MVTWPHVLGQIIMVQEHVAKECCLSYGRQKSEKETGKGNRHGTCKDLPPVT